MIVFFIATYAIVRNAHLFYLSRIEIPGFVPDSTARHWRALVFLGVGVPLRTVDDARESIRVARKSE